MMIEVWIDRSDVNIELLDAQLRAVGGDLVYGVSTQRGGVMVYISEAMSEKMRKQLAQIVRTHDSTQMTPQQEIAAERYTLLQEARSDAPLSTEDFNGADTLTRALAKKIAWLEQEIRELRGLS
jgi:hypothetical protein